MGFGFGLQSIVIVLLLLLLVFINSTYVTYSHCICVNCATGYLCKQLYFLMFDPPIT